MEERPQSGPRLAVTHGTFHRSWTQYGGVTEVGRMGLVGLLLGDHAVRNLMKGKWPLFPRSTTQSLPESPTLSFPGEVHCTFRLAAASNFLFRSKLSSVDQKSLQLGMVPAEPTGDTQVLHPSPRL